MAAPLTFTIDLINGTHDLPTNNFVSFKDVPVDTNNDGYFQTVLKINLDDPNLSNPYDKVEFEITYDQAPDGEINVNIGDSATNNGQAGDAATQSNDAELQIGTPGLDGDRFLVWGNDYSGPINLQNIDNFVSGPSTVNLTVANEYLEWDNNSGIADNLSSPFLYALDGQVDNEGPVNYDIFAAFNRVIAGNYRLGSGVSEVTVTLIDSNEPTPEADDLLGTEGNDTIEALAGNDTVSGLGGNDVLKGQAGNDILNGDNGRDKLKGGSGDDVLNGGSGNDVLTGGNGADDFFIVSPLDGVDKIKDFDASEGDKIVIDSTGFNTTDLNDFGSLFNPFTGTEELYFMHASGEYTLIAKLSNLNSDSDFNINSDIEFF